jgi:hypothetical protein
MSHTIRWTVENHPTLALIRPVIAAAAAACYLELQSGGCSQTRLDVQAMSSSKPIKANIRRFHLA